MGDLLGIAGLLLVAAAWAAWIRALVSVRVPANRSAYLVAMAVGSLLGAASFATGPGSVAAGLALAAGITFLGLRVFSGQDVTEPSVAVGGPIIDFQAPDENGEIFDLASLRGRPFLLKFFRGHW